MKRPTEGFVWRPTKGGGFVCKVGKFELEVPAPSDYERPRDLWHSAISLISRTPFTMRTAQDEPTPTRAMRLAERAFEKLVNAAVEVRKARNGE